MEELLRYDGPVQRTARVPSEDITIAGRTIPKGDMVMPFIGAADRDPAQFPEPDRLDLGRADNRHIAFGWGIHFCIGAPLARVEGQIALGALVRKLPKLALATEKPAHRLSLTLSGPGDAARLVLGGRGMVGDLAVLLAGFVLAHCAWSVSDLPRGELLVPMAMIEKSGYRQLLRFQADTQEQAIADGKATLAKRQADLDAWAFGREGLMQEGLAKVDVLTIDAWGKGMARPSPSSRSSLLPRPEPFGSSAIRSIFVDGKAVEGAEAARLLKTLGDGVRQHPKVGQLIESWRVK